MSGRSSFTQQWDDLGKKANKKINRLQTDEYGTIPQAYEEQK